MKNNAHKTNNREKCDRNKENNNTDKHKYKQILYIYINKHAKTHKILLNCNTIYKKTHFLKITQKILKKHIFQKNHILHGALLALVPPDAAACRIRIVAVGDKHSVTPAGLAHAVALVVADAVLDEPVLPPDAALAGVHGCQYPHDLDQMWCPDLALLPKLP